MAVKIHTNDELKKMGKKDRMKILKQSLAEKAHAALHLRSKEDKQSHKKQALAKQIARIHTYNRQDSLTPAEDAK